MSSWSFGSTSILWAQTLPFPTNQSAPLQLLCTYVPPLPAISPASLGSLVLLLLPPWSIFLLALPRISKIHHSLYRFDPTVHDHNPGSLEFPASSWSLDSIPVHLHLSGCRYVRASHSASSSVVYSSVSSSAVYSTPMDSSSQGSWCFSHHFRFCSWCQEFPGRRGYTGASQ